MNYNIVLDSQPRREGEKGIKDWSTRRRQNNSYGAAGGLHELTLI